MPAQRIAGRYEVVRPLGEGPLGKVYQVADHGSDPPGRVATLKILRADALDYDRLDACIAEMEPRLVALRHPGINPLERIGRTPLGLLYLASGYAAGENLRALLARRGPLPPARVAAIAHGILAPLAAAHAARLAHGDLHPGNVLLRHGAGWSADDPFGTAVVLLDLGLLELIGAERPVSLAPYLAPELADNGGDERDEGERAAPTPRSDVFAAGAILLELLTGRTEPAPEDVPAAWRAPLTAALAPEPSARPADAAALLSSLPAAAASAEAPEAAEGRRELAVVAARLHDAEQRAAAAERDLEAALSTSFARLAERDATLAELRAAHDGGAAQTNGHAASELARMRSALAGARVLAGALALAVLATGALWWRARDAVVVAATPTDDPTLIARAEDAERENELLRGAQLEADEATQAALAAQGQERATLAAELEAWKESDRALRADLDERARERDAALAAAEAAERSLAERADAIGEARTRLGELEVELGRARDPELFALDQLDRVLAALAADDGRAARARYQSLLVTNPDLAGLDGLDRLTALALRLEEADEAEDLLAEIARRREAAAALADAAGANGTALLADAAWVHREGQRRSEEIRGALERLRERHGAARTNLHARLETRWRTLLNESPDVAPREVLEIAGWLGDGRVAEFLDWQARYLRDTLESGGMLEVPALLKLRHLDAWAEVVAADPALRESVSGREVLLFRYARLWRNTPADATPPAPAGVVFQDASGEPAAAGWRADLALRARLCGPDAAWPGGAGSRFLYRVAAVVDGEPTVTWQLDEVAATEPDAWRVRRTFFRDDGSLLHEAEVRIERVGKRFVEENRPGGALLDAGSERAYRAAFEPALDAAPPADLVDPDAFEAFRAALEDAPAEALAYENLGMTSWFAPGFGLLAIESAESFRRELSWADPRPR